MSSLSAMSHAGQAPSSSQAGTDPNHSHSPTMQLMSQPPNHGTPVQPESNVNPNGSYVSVHRFSVAPQGPEGYAHHVMPYAQEPPPPGGELVFTTSGDLPGPSAAASSETGLGENNSASSSANGSASANSKRKQPDSTSEAAARKRRQRVGEDAADADGEDLNIGPNGGPKHWTEDEKTRFFTWMLTNDDHWDAFRTRMNTVFRECSSELFPGKKSYTALKSCFHRNLEVFKQIHAFQLYSNNYLRQLQTENPDAEQPNVDIVLDAARAAGLNVGSLNVKVIDRWYETGWYELFGRRYKDDPKTGLPAPYYGDQPEAGPPTSSAPQAMLGLQAPVGSLDTQIMVRHTAPHPSDKHAIASTASPDPPHPPPPLANGAYITYSSLPPTADYHQTGQSSSYTTAPTYLRSSNTGPPRSLQTVTSQGSVHPPTATPSRTQGDSALHREPSYPEHFTQAAQILAQLHVVTDSLLNVCSSMKTLIQQQAEESRVRTELMRAEAAQRQQSTGGAEGRGEKEISIEKVTFATEILKNGPENEDIKKAAIECLTKYLMRGL
ncbi:hypothetical protein C8Q79DRAFT_949823 [Trametes meyenii]|nr:hypothetical protein C8Q79DRAFT_949823 [Trametes meyenii]